MYEPQFKIFYEIPIYELTRVEKEARETMEIDDIVKVDERLPWPEVEFLFGEDEEYQDIIADIMRNVTLSISNITTCAAVLKNFQLFLSQLVFILSNLGVQKILQYGIINSKIKHRKITE